MPKVNEFLKTLANSAGVTISEDISKQLQNEAFDKFELPDDFFGSITEKFVLAAEAEKRPEIRARISKQVAQDLLSETIAKIDAKGKLKIDENIAAGMRQRIVGGTPLSEIQMDLMDMLEAQTLLVSGKTVDEQVRIEQAKHLEINATWEAKYNAIKNELLSKDREYEQKAIRSQTMAIAANLKLKIDGSPSNIVKAAIWQAVQDNCLSLGVSIVGKDDQAYLVDKDGNAYRVRDRAVPFDDFVISSITGAGLLQTGENGKNNTPISKTNPSEPIKTQTLGQREAAQRMAEQKQRFAEANKN